MVEKLVPCSFLRNQNWAYIWINSLKCFTVCFYCISKLRSTVVDHLLFYPIQSFFLKKSNFLSYFLHRFWRKMFTKFFFLIKVIFWMLFLLEKFGKMCIVIIWNFEIYLSFFIKRLCYMTTNVRTKI